MCARGEPARRGLEVALGHLEAGQPARPPHLDHAAAVVDHANDGEMRFDVGVVDLGFDDVVGALVARAAEQEAVERDLVERQPGLGGAAGGLIAARDDDERVDVGMRGERIESQPAEHALRQARYPQMVHTPAQSPILFTDGDEDSELIMPPDPAPDVCLWCRGPKLVSEQMCSNCLLNATILGGLQEVVPITLYSKPSRLRDWLTFYKSYPSSAADPNARLAISHITRRYFATNSSFMHSLGIEAVIVVPSASRPAPHPLRILLDGLPEVQIPTWGGLRRTKSPIGHNAPRVDAFRALPWLRGRRVLLFDDVYTTGARVQSAAMALEAVGCDVAAAWVLGRRCNPEWSPEVGAIYRAQKGVRFSWDASARLSATGT